MELPFVIERTSTGERACDIYSRLLKDGIIFLGKEIDNETSAAIIAQMLFLQLEKKDINFYIMSPGGAVTAGMAIYDIMQHVQKLGPAKLPTVSVATYCLGEAASMGAFLLAAGTKGKRFALPSARIMIHQPWGAAIGDISTAARQMAEMQTLKDMLNSKLAKHVGKKVEQVAKDTDRDFFMSAEEALEYGIIDKILA